MFCKSAAAVGRPANTHQELKHPLDARFHLFLFDKLPPVGLRDALSHRGAKPGVLLKQAQGGILHQPLGIRAGMTGDLGNCASCSGVKWTSMLASLGARAYGVNGRLAPATELFLCSRLFLFLCS